MGTPEDRDDPRVDEEARERSAEQRNITAPTPRDVRAKREEHGAGEQPEPDDGTPAP